MSRESSLQAWAIRWLNEQEKTIARNCGTGAGHVEGDPDVYGCVEGQMFQMEFKNSIGKLRPAQEYRLDQWHKAGAICFLLRNRDQVRDAWAQVQEAARQRWRT